MSKNKTVISITEIIIFGLLISSITNILMLLNIIIDYGWSTGTSTVFAISIVILIGTIFLIIILYSLGKIDFVAKSTGIPISYKSKTNKYSLPQR